MGFHLAAIRGCAGREAKFLDGLSNSAPAVRLYREGRATGPPEDKSQQTIARGKTMSAIIQFVPAADLSFLTTDNKVSAFPHREPEQRLWKLFSQTVSPKFAMIELFVFMLFLVVTVIGIISCFAELSSLLQSGAINHLTMEALNGGA
jgi:hypothetical protein